MEPTSQFLPIPTPPERQSSGERFGWKMTDTSSIWKTQTTPVPPPSRSWQSGTECGELGNQQRARWGGGSHCGWGRAPASGAWNSSQCGLQPCLTRLRTTQLTLGAAQATGPKPLRWAHRPPLHLQAQGSDKEISGASSAGGLKYRTGRHSCQAEAGGAVNRTVLFAVTKPKASLLCMCQGLLGRFSAPHGDL